MSTTIPSAQRLTVTREVVCQVRFSQVSPQGPTILNISFTGLNARAGGYHIHILPIKTSSPAPRNGTVDQYEIGDISGKFGDLTGQNNFQNQDMDGNMPLSGPNSIIGRSLVIHYANDGSVTCHTANLQLSCGLAVACGRTIYMIYSND
uniref:Superoxide dismutase copper/zinc binding domain-containing protein n=1 Tax=Sinocyclocheilus rhinocerous TaxID=307959 RepID=A0A673G8U3_9TELE